MQVQQLNIIMYEEHHKLGEDLGHQEEEVGGLKQRSGSTETEPSSAGLAACGAGSDGLCQDHMTDSREASSTLRWSGMDIS